MQDVKYLPRPVPLSLMLHLILIRLDVDDRVQIVQDVAKLIFQLLREPMGFDEGVRVGDLNMDIQVPV